MSRSQLPANSHSLSEDASSLLCRIPQLLRRLRNLENEETELNARARQLMQPELSMAKDRPPMSVTSTPVSKLRIKATGSAVDRGTTHIDPGNTATPVKTFLLMEPLELAMSVKSKRKGRIFLRGDSTEFGERKQI